jgi:hypothetical protein
LIFSLFSISIFGLGILAITLGALGTLLCSFLRRGHTCLPVRFRLVFSLQDGALNVALSRLLLLSHFLCA